MNEKYPKVGVGVIVRKDGKVLLGKRKNAHGEGAWAFPGGHLKYGESWEACAEREVMEETGITVKGIRFAAATNDIFSEEEKHYITLFMMADYDSGKVEICEPEKCERWEWFLWDSLPSPLFLPIENLIQTGYTPYRAV